MAIVSNMKDIKRVFQYHGAEHKTIACYEAGEELTVEQALYALLLYSANEVAYAFDHKI